MWCKDIVCEFGRFCAPLFRRESKGGFEEVEEGGFARGSGADDENAKQRLVGMDFNKLETVKTHWKGVGSFRLLTLRGRLIVLTALLA